jgi:hypothetical protein
MSGYITPIPHMPSLSEQKQLYTTCAIVILPSKKLNTSKHVAVRKKVYAHAQGVKGLNEFILRNRFY